MVKINIDEDVLIDLLVERVKFWTDDADTIELFTQMYSDLVDCGCFDDMEFDINRIVDNDYINYTRIICKDDEDYDEIDRIVHEQGLGDCSCQTNICDSILAYTNEKYLVR